GAEGAGEAGDWRAGELARGDLPLEGSLIFGEVQGHEGPADGFVARLAEVEPEVDEHRADAARLRIVALGERTDRRRLALLETIERNLQAFDRAGDAALGEKVRARIGIPIRGEEGPLVAARFGRARFPARSAARRLFDRGVGLAEAVERAGARLQRRLSAQNLFELLFVPLLIDQLPAP